MHRLEQRILAPDATGTESAESDHDCAEETEQCTVTFGSPKEIGGP